MDHPEVPQQLHPGGDPEERAAVCLPLPLRKVVFSGGCFEFDGFLSEFLEGDSGSCDQMSVFLFFFQD